MNKTESHYFTNIIVYSIVFITIYTISPYARINITNTTIWWAINYTLLIAFFIYINKFYKSSEATYLHYVSYYLLWNVICIIRGGIIAENYWDWKELANNTLCLLLPIISYTCTNLLFVKMAFNIYLKIALPLFLVVFYFIPTDAYGFYLAPVGILMLFFPVLPKNAKIIGLILTFLVLVIDLGARSNVIKFAVPLCFMTAYYFQKNLSVGFIENARKILFIIPIVLFVLALTEVFNIFNINQYSDIDYKETRIDASGQASEDDLSADTRTALYEEVLSSAKKNNYWWLGRTPARGNDSNLFYDVLYITGRPERLSNEVGILNVFTWTGIIGVFLYFLVFYSSSYIALHHSNNFFCKIISIYISFRWIYCWVEDINDFTLNMFMLWLLIGLVNTKQFRKMTDEEIGEWIKGIFIFRR